MIYVFSAIGWWKKVINSKYISLDVLCLYTLFQNGRHFSIPLFSSKLALVASFLTEIVIQKNISLKRGNKS